MIQVYEGNGEHPASSLVIECEYAQRTGAWNYIPAGEIRYQITCKNAGEAQLMQGKVKHLRGERLMCHFASRKEPPHYVTRTPSLKQTHLVRSTVHGKLARCKIQNQMLFLAFVEADP